MASLSNDGGNKYRVMWGNPPHRQVIRIRESARDAERFKDKLERLVMSRAHGQALDAELIDWLASMDNETHAKLAGKGLDAPRRNEAEKQAAERGQVLAALMDKFFTVLAGKKPGTMLAYRSVRYNLENYFGKDKPIATITTADADSWRAWLVAHEKLAPGTVGRRVIAARTMFNKALRWGMVESNVFVGVEAGSQVNEARKRFISREIIDKTIAEAPDAEWAAIIALARYAGLRVPSELFTLRWSDVDFEQGRMTIHSPKTERHAGGASRIAPLFAELRPYLEALFNESAAQGEVYVVSKHRLGALNLRTEFERIIKRAGLLPWPKLFHNLRASRESELMREYDLATVCKWIGNSPAVAAKHYAVSVDLDADFQRASGRAAQKAAQYRPEIVGNGKKRELAENENRPVFPSDSDACRTLPDVVHGPDTIRTYDLVLIRDAL